MKKGFLHFATLLGLLMLTNCSEDDVEPLDPSIIPSESMAFLHNNNSKKWRITSYYSSFKDLVIEEAYTSCVNDDTYTFSSTDRNSVTEFGEIICFENFPEEISAAVYTYYPEEQRLYLDFSRGGYSSTVSSFELIITKCILLTEEKMIFVNGEERNYGIGLVFEKVE